MSDYDSVLIYDGDCPYCSITGKAIRRLDDIGIVPWQEDESKEFLRAQFGSVPFAMFLVDARGNKIYAGKAAARELSERAGLPRLVNEIVEGEYENIASVVGLASGRTRDVDNYHGVYTISESALKEFDSLSNRAENVSDVAIP